MAGASSTRSPSRRRPPGRFVRRVTTFLLRNSAWFWRLLERIGPLQRITNKAIIDRAVTATRNRPHAFSTVSSFTSWDSLTDRTYFGRHLEPIETPRTSPPVDDVVRLFKRPPEGGQLCPKSTLLFPVFAQYLTDGFLRTNMDDRTRTTSNHEIDLSPLYGRKKAQTDVLREKSETSGRRGRLLSQNIDGEDFPPYLYLDNEGTVDPRFTDDKGFPVLDLPLGVSRATDETRTREIFAVGGDRVNSTPFVTIMNLLFLREHNRLAAELEHQFPSWNDDQVFQTARNITIVIYIKLVVEEYINHISSVCFNLRADPKVAWMAQWNRPSWMTIEFTLLYRWHALIPDNLAWNNDTQPSGRMLMDNRFATKRGLRGAFADMTRTQAMKLTWFNTPDFLQDVERTAILQDRLLQLPGLNEYRRAFGMSKHTSFDQVTSDQTKLEALRKLYSSPDDVGFYEGLFAEDVNLNTPMPPLMGAMVAVDAFSQALTNPLMSEHVYGPQTFTEWGLDQIESTATLQDIVLRNSPDTDGSEPLITMTHPDWKRVKAPF